MKYPSVFLSIFFVWAVVVALALILNNSSLTFDLYKALIVFSTVMFLIGFWRNR